MERYKRYEPDQYMWIDYRPEVLYPKGSFEHFIVNTLKLINIDGFWEKEDKGGEDPFHPRGMLGILFYAICLGLFSSRKIEAACREHLGFMYVSGHMKPDHATICRFIVMHFEALKEVLSMLLYLAHEQGYLDYREIAIDGTKIKANASKRFSGTIGDFDKRRNKYEKKIEHALVKLQEANDDKERKYWEGKKERYEENKVKLEDFLQNAAKEYNNQGKERVQNITDPDSRMMKLGKEYKQGYNAQIGVSGNGMIVAADVVTDENDMEMLPHMVEEIGKSKPEGAERGGVKYLCDNGYLSRPVMGYVEENNLDVYMPLSADKHAYDEEKQKAETKVSVEECTVREDEESIVLTCPGGRSLKKKKEANREVYTFMAGVASNCEGCEHFNRCRGYLKGIDKKFEVTAEYLKMAGFIEAHRQKMQTDAARRIYSRRMDIVEKVFGQLKEDWGYKKMLRRTLPRAKCEWLFVVIAYNLKKLFTISTQKWTQNSALA
jgi:hypothetical protein